MLHFIKSIFKVRRPKVGDIGEVQTFMAPRSYGEVLFVIDNKYKCIECFNESREKISVYEKVKVVKHSSKNLSIWPITGKIGSFRW